MPSVLACTDLSPSGPLVIEHAAWAARKMRASVRLLHVDRLRSHGSRRHEKAAISSAPVRSSFPASVAVESPAIEAIFARARTQLQRAGIADVATDTRQGDLAGIIAAVYGQAALVVMSKPTPEAARGESGLGRSERRLLAGAHPPILFVSRALAPVRTVLVAFDGRAASLRALRFLAKNTLFGGVFIHLLGVGRKKTVLQRQLEAARDLLREAGRMSDAQWLPGEPERVMPRVFKNEQIDLLVMGAFGDAKVRRLIYGSTTTALLTAAEMPVLVF